MKKITFLLFVALLQTSFAQTKLLTMEEAVVKQRGALAPSRLKQLMWVKGTDIYSYVSRTETQDILVTKTIEGTKMTAVVNLTDLNAALTAAGQKKTSSFPIIQWKDSKQFTFELDKKLLNYSTETKKISISATRDFGEDAENMDVAEKTNYVAFTVKNNLFIYDGKNNLIVTNDKDENIVNGKSVHREEFGIAKGTFWSPSGNMLAFYRMDQTMVTDYPLTMFSSLSLVTIKLFLPS